MRKFKVGDRVQVVRGDDFRKHLGQVLTVSRGPIGSLEGGNYYFNETDTDTAVLGDHLELATNKGDAPMARKTYKLIRDTPTVKKGAIYQEACDDGTQEYILLGREHFKDTKHEGVRFDSALFDRSLVEDAPKWFVEVFQIEPQYVTAEELKRWEAFKAIKPKKVVQVPVVVASKTGWTPARRKAHGARIKAMWAAKRAA